MKSVKCKMKKLEAALFRRVDNSPLIVFRIIFGFLLCYHVVDALRKGKVYHLFIHPPFTFTYIGFEFLQPLPGKGMYFYFGLMALLALFVMLGFLYRFAMLGFTLLWTGIYLMQKVDYNNHYYLVLLLCLFMSSMPANAYFSVDAARKPSIKKLWCYQWVIWLFIAQMAIVYFYAAASKFTGDWLSGRFMAYRFSGLAKHPHYGFIYGSNIFQGLLTYGGIAFDFLIVPALIWRKTRPYAFVVSCLFHLFNSFTFHIGIFPYLSIALNIFFFEPEKIRQLFLKKKPTFITDSDLKISESQNRGIKHSLVVYALCVYLLVQLIVPLRFLLFPGNVFWTEEGYKLSWKMMLRVKKGEVHFKVVDPSSSQTWIINPVEKLSPMYAYWLAISPDMMWQYAQRLKNDFAQHGHQNVQVYAAGWVRLNGRDPKPLVDSTVNLAAVKWEPFRHSSWITEDPK